MTSSEAEEISAIIFGLTLLPLYYLLIIVSKLL